MGILINTGNHQVGNSKRNGSINQQSVLANR